MRGVQIIPNFWRESGRGLRLFWFSAWAGVPLLAFLLHISLITLGALMATIVFMTIIERFGYTIPVAILVVRSKLAGKTIKRRHSMFNRKLDR